MHELSLIQRVLDMALEVSRLHGSLPITRVCVEVGTLQNVVPDLLAFAFEAASNGTRAEGAVFDWREIPARVACHQCQTEFAPVEVFWTCPACGAVGGRVIQGDDMVLVSVELRDTASA